MKTLLTIFSVILSMALLNAQSGFNFKGLVTDANGNPLSNHNLTVRISIKRGSVLIWDENHTSVTTDQYGIFSVVMGEGTRLGGNASTFNDINWKASNLRYTVRINSGNGYQTLVNNARFQSVPYAKVASSLRNVHEPLVVVGEDGKLRFASNDNAQNHYDFYMSGTGGMFLHLQYNNNDLMKFTGAAEIQVYPAMKVNDLGVSGKITSDAAGAADLKAYVYGGLFANGSVMSCSSDGFTARKLSTGRYRITFTDNSVHDNYVAVVTAQDVSSGVMANVDLNNGQFDVYIFDKDGNRKDAPLWFVVYKK